MWGKFDFQRPTLLSIPLSTLLKFGFGKFILYLCIEISNG